MSVDISAHELTWNGSQTVDRTIAQTLSDTVKVDMSGGDGQYLFVFSSTESDTLSVEVATGSEFWMHDQGTTSVEIGNSTDSDAVVLGPFEGGRFKDGSSNDLVFETTMTGAGSVTANAWLNPLKVPKG